MSIVYVPQEPRTRDEFNNWKPLYDLSPALKFGTLELLLPNGPMSLDADSVIATLQEKLDTYTPEDYIMCIGDPAAIAAAVLVAGLNTDGAVTLLKYDRSERQYNIIRLKA